MKRYFITGTDTDCGKTYVTCQLLAQLNQHAPRGLGLKPVASGCREQGGVLLSEDAERIARMQSCDQPICQWAFKPPISPHSAARQAGVRLSAEAIAEFCAAPQFSQFEMMLVEGAGGLMVPLNEEQTWLDFLRLTAMPVIMVVGIRLGCLNHALLTEQVLRFNNLKCAGWVANCLSEEDAFCQDNITTLQQKMQIPHLATLAWQGIFSKEVTQYLL